MPVYVKERPWMRRVEGGFEIDLTIDSGAVTTIAPVDTLPGIKPRETEASRRGITYTVANGGEIKKQGEITLRGLADNGTKMNVIAQASDVTKPLASAREILKGGNRIVMEENVSYIENMKTKKRIPIQRKNGMFIVTMKVADEKQPYGESQYAVMAAEDKSEKEKTSFHRQVKNLI